MHEVKLQIVTLIFLVSNHTFVFCLMSKIILFTRIKQPSPLWFMFGSVLYHLWIMAYVPVAYVSSHILSVFPFPHRRWQNWCDPTFFFCNMRSASSFVNQNCSCFPLFCLCFEAYFIKDTGCLVHSITSDVYLVQKAISMCCILGNILVSI